MQRRNKLAYCYLKQLIELVLLNIVLFNPIVKSSCYRNMPLFVIGETGTLCEQLPVHHLDLYTLNSRDHIALKITKIDFTGISRLVISKIFLHKA